MINLLTIVFSYEKIADNRHLKPSCQGLSLEIMFLFLEFSFAKDK